MAFLFQCGMVLAAGQHVVAVQLNNGFAVGGNGSLAGLAGVDFQVTDGHCGILEGHIVCIALTGNGDAVGVVVRFLVNDGTGAVGDGHKLAIDRNIAVGHIPCLIFCNAVSVRKGRGRDGRDHGHYRRRGKHPQGEFIRFRMFCLHKNLPLIPSLFLPVPPPRSVRKGEGAHFLYDIPPSPSVNQVKTAAAALFLAKMRRVHYTERKQ